jgi:hypothetical protein
VVACAGGGSVTVWEYTIVAFRDANARLPSDVAVSELKEGLNTWGAEGWEVCAYSPYGGIFYLKRQVAG